MPFTYVLQSLTTRHYYTGAAANLEIRLAQHNSDQTRSTKFRGPWVVVHREEFATIAEALRRERFLKSGKGRDFLRQILKPKLESGTS
jgi:putative endonuclease